MEVEDLVLQTYKYLKSKAGFSIGDDEANLSLFKEARKIVCFKIKQELIRKEK